MDEAYRLTFLYGAGGFELVDTQRLRMRVPAGRAADTDAVAVGHFVELRSAGGESLYRRAFAPLAGPRMEYPGEEGRMAWATAVAPMTISVLVPAQVAARSVALVEQVAVPAAAGLVAGSRILRHDLIEVALAQPEVDDGQR